MSRDGTLTSFFSSGFFLYGSIFPSVDFVHFCSLQLFLPLTFSNEFVSMNFPPPSNSCEDSHWSPSLCVLFSGTPYPFVRTGSKAVFFYRPLSPSFLFHIISAQVSYGRPTLTSSAPLPPCRSLPADCTRCDLAPFFLILIFVEVFCCPFSFYFSPSPPFKKSASASEGFVILPFSPFFV